MPPSTRRRSFSTPQILMAVFAAGAGLASPSSAQQVLTEPASTHIFPAGGRRGTTVPVRVGGEFLPPYTRFRLFGAGVLAPAELVEPAWANYEPSLRRKPGGFHINYPREWQSEIAIAPDAPLGQTLWRVASARGGTGGRPFIIGDLPEFIETESNSTLETAESVTLPVVINGQIAGERDSDYFRFDLPAGAAVSIDVAAARLGSPLDPVLELTDARGRRLAAEEERRGSDPVWTWRASAGGEVRLRVANLNFHGGPQYVYRATLTTVATPTDAEAAAEAADSSADVEPNDDAAHAAPIAAAGSVGGRFQSDADQDWYAFSASAGQAVTLECTPHPRGSGAWPEITVCDANGAPLARASTVELTPRPCRIEWRSPADGTYTVRVRDVRQGGNRSDYRLTLRPTLPEFSLTAAADVVNVLQGGRGEIDLTVDRQGGLGAPIDLAIAGLPEGVRFEPAQIPANVESFKLALLAIDDARPGDSTLKIVGTAKVGEQAISRTAAAAHLGRDLEGISLGSPVVDHVQLTVRHKQVFRLYCSEAYQYAHRGTVYPYLMEVERMNGFDGPIEIEMGDRQIMDHDGVQVQKMTAPAASSQFLLPIHLPETMHINIQPHSNIYAQGWVVFTDKWGQRQSMLQVSEMRCMIRPLPTVAKLRCREKSVVLRPGASQTVALQVDRTTNFSGPLHVELVQPGAGIHMTPIEIAAGETTALATISCEAECQRLPRRVRLRGTGSLPGDVTVVTEAELAVAGDGLP